jgi:hypothetical protein
MNAIIIKDGIPCFVEGWPEEKDITASLRGDYAYEQAKADAIARALPISNVWDFFTEKFGKWYRQDNGSIMFEIDSWPYNWPGEFEKISQGYWKEGYKLILPTQEKPCDVEMHLRNVKAKIEECKKEREATQEKKETDGIKATVMGQGYHINKIKVSPLASPESREELLRAENERLQAEYTAERARANRAVERMQEAEKENAELCESEQKLITCDREREEALSKIRALKVVISQLIPIAEARFNYATNRSLIAPYDSEERQFYKIEAERVAPIITKAKEAIK